MFNDLIGKKFKDGGRGPNFYDCWGLCIEAYRRIGVFLPDYNISALACLQVVRTIRCQTERSSSWRELAEPCKHVIVAFPHHTGFMIDRTNFLHVRMDIPTCVEKISNPLWKEKIVGFYDYVH